MAFEVAKALNSLLENGFSQVMFRYTDQEPGKYQHPSFYICDLPAKRKKNDPATNERESNAPYFVTRISRITDEEESSVVYLETHCGIYTAENEAAGDNDLSNMIMRGRRLILENQMLDNRFELVFPMSSMFGDAEAQHAQPHPFHEGVIKTAWKIPAVERITSIEDEEKIYGSNI